MTRSFLGARVAPLFALALLHLPAQAINLVEFTFGSGVGTTTAQTVATHLAATPVAGRKADGSVAPHSFVDLGGGNMAMQLLKSEGGYMFDFTLSADPGFTFQVTDAHFGFIARNTAGSNRNIAVWPNADAGVNWFDSAGGDITVTDLGPGGFGWKEANWSAFVTRDDLQTLRVQLSLKGNSPASLAIFDRVLLEGNVVAVPEPASALLFAAGALWVLRRRRSTLP
ncbi:PEP-CTERM sorting domain-containing protein [Paucibacter soli]|uniref:PEP-CTERM sorting domain-containing protein n=1 Tax=Paucibacter soli TaxID=3133433 RepID=UPI0030ABEEA4